MKKYILFSILTVFFSFVAFTQQLTQSKKQQMIDSAFDARTDRYLRRCFPDFSIQIKYEKDSFELCSIETVLMVAPNITENQIPLLEGFMVNMANYYISNNEPVTFDDGTIPADIDDNFDRMFKSREIYVGTSEGTDSHSRVNHLLNVFNMVVYIYFDKEANLK